MNFLCRHSHLGRDRTEYVSFKHTDKGKSLRLRQTRKIGSYRITSWDMHDTVKLTLYAYLKDTNMRHVMRPIFF